MEFMRIVIFIVVCIVWGIVTKSINENKKKLQEKTK